MTNTVLDTTDWPLEILVRLRREELLSQGRHNAFLFALKCKGDATCLYAEVQATEEKLTNPPDHLQDSLKPNASPRVYKDGYLAGLRDALTILTQTTNGAQPDTALAEPTPTATTQPHAETTDAQRELRAGHAEHAEHAASTTAVTTPPATLAPPSE